MTVPCSERKRGMTNEELLRMKACSPLLPPPGGGEVCKLVDIILKERVTMLVEVDRAEDAEQRNLEFSVERDELLRKIETLRRER